MPAVRRARTLRFFAIALVVWLAADALSHGVCPHDLSAFAPSRACCISGDVGQNGHDDQANDRDDINHCSCHWQFLPAITVHLAASRVSVPLTAPVPRSLPQPDQPALERPPQGC